MSLINRTADSFCVVGVIIGLAFMCASLTPSLLPRGVVHQGVLSGVVFAAGYGLGKFGLWLWRFMELKDLRGRAAKATMWSALVVLSVATVFTLNRTAVWQNSIRERMGMESIDTAFPVAVFLVALVTAVGVILLARLIFVGARKIVDATHGFLPRRISIVVGTALFLGLFLFLVNGVILRATLSGMDESFAALNQVLDDEYDPPDNPLASGSAKSLIDWADIGRNGKRFIADGPSKDEIAEATGRAAKQPLRVYAGFDTGETLEERAQIALDELLRVGAFDRSALIIATPTGTGWLDPSGVNTIEFLHAGDTAIVAMQYSYLPSWLTLLVEPSLAREAANALFRPIYRHWASLPEDGRPALYLFGLSLGALGSEDSADLITMIGNPIDGAVWSGPPFPSRVWRSVTRNRNPDSPQWRPTFRDSSMIRFMTQDGFAELDGASWGPLRIVYLQHASDPMTFFSPDLAYRRPDWLGQSRGRDVSPYLRWFPIVTFVQVGFDIPLATSVPLGYGHNIAPDNYIDAWVEVTQPRKWSESDTRRLKLHFADFNPSPL